jgi:hypothetical protein
MRAINQQQQQQLAILAQQHDQLKGQATRHLISLKTTAFLLALPV